MDWLNIMMLSLTFLSLWSASYCSADGCMVRGGRWWVSATSWRLKLCWPFVSLLPVSYCCADDHMDKECITWVTGSYELPYAALYSFHCVPNQVYTVDWQRSCLLTSVREQTLLSPPLPPPCCPRPTMSAWLLCLAAAATSAAPFLRCRMQSTKLLRMKANLHSSMSWSTPWLNAKLKTLTGWHAPSYRQTLL